VLALLGDSVSDAVKSGAHGIVREISSGVQTYETDPSLYPVNQPIGKYEGKSQCTGEAVFVNDMPTFPGELCAAIVVSTVANCELDTVDPSEALVSTHFVPAKINITMTSCACFFFRKCLEWFLMLIIKTFLAGTVPSKMKVSMRSYLVQAK
jgi:hypothetical protein